MSKIFIFAQPSTVGSNFVTGEALTEDGEFIAGHISSDVEWTKHDMGITSDWKHKYYSEYYPDGYELEWVDDPANHEGLQAAYKLHLAKYSAKDESGEVVSP